MQDNIVYLIYSSKVQVVNLIAYEANTINIFGKWHWIMVVIFLQLIKVIKQWKLFSGALMLWPKI